MNALCIFEHERISARDIVLQAERAVYARTRHGARPEALIHVVCWNGPRGVARVIEDGADMLTLSLVEEFPPIVRPSTELIVATPRPQAIRRVLQFAASFGVAAVHFVRSAEVEKSYLSSTALTPQAIREELVKSLEQLRDACAPEVQVHPRFKPFLEDFLAPRVSPTGIALLADTDARHEGLPLTPIDAQQQVLIAIGPESGWNDYERSMFHAIGFRAVSLGPRILRVDVAVAALCAQVSLLRAQSPSQR